MRLLRGGSGDESGAGDVHLGEDIPHDRRVATRARRLRRDLRRAVWYCRPRHAPSTLLWQLPAHPEPLRARRENEDDRCDRTRAKAQGPRTLE